LTHTPARNPHDSNQPDLSALAARLAALASIPWCDRCGTAVTAVLADSAHLLRTAAQLRDDLAAVRLDAANLRAAMQAALGAADDGEPDPLAFLRWELAGPSDHRGRR